MQSTFDRRAFLRNCAAVPTAAALLGLTAGSALGIDPIARNGSPKFKFSLAAYSYRGLLTGKPAKLTLADFIDDCAKMQLDGTELTSYYFSPSVTDAELRKFKQHCFRLGLCISGTAVGNDFGFPAGEQREQQIAGVKQWIDRAEVLGAPVIRIFAGSQKNNQSPRQTHNLMVEGIEECCDYAGRRGVHLAMENHGGPTATADGMLKFIRDVRSEWFGVNLDTGNFASEDPYGDLAKIAPYALNVQVKTMITVKGELPEKQPADFARFARLLREANYRGFIVLEYEERSDPRVECLKYVEQMREAFA